MLSARPMGLTNFVGEGLMIIYFSIVQVHFVFS